MNRALAASLGLTSIAVAAIVLVSIITLFVAHVWMPIILPFLLGEK